MVLAKPMMSGLIAWYDRSVVSLSILLWNLLLILWKISMNELLLLQGRSPKAGIWMSEVVGLFYSCLRLFSPGSSTERSVSIGDAAGGWVAGGERCG